MPLSKFFGEPPVFLLKGAVFYRESKEKRSASYFLLSVLKSCRKVTPVVYSFFGRHNYRHRPLSLTFQFSISLHDCFLRKREMFTSGIYSHWVFWKQAVTRRQNESLYLSVWNSERSSSAVPCVCHMDYLKIWSCRFSLWNRKSPPIFQSEGKSCYIFCCSSLLCSKVGGSASREG